MTTAWYVIQSKPKKENQVHAYLKSQDIDVFYPSVRVDPVNPRSAKIRPYFPRYMFVHVDLDTVGLSALRWVPGAIGLVEFEGIAAPVPENIVHELKRRISEIEDAGGMFFDDLQQGDPVRITHGPLAGYEAIFDMRLSGAQRVQVLMEMLGRQVRMTVDASLLERRSNRS